MHEGGGRTYNWVLRLTHLYSLATDLHEDNDVAAQHPDVVKKLVDIVYKEHVDSPLFPITLPKVTP